MIMNSESKASIFGDISITLIGVQELAQATAAEEMLCTIARFD
jgi:hypothetical protein